MNRCPNCHQSYSDEIIYCLADGTYLVADQSDVPTVIVNPIRPNEFQRNPTLAKDSSRWQFLIMGVLGSIAIVLAYALFFRDDRAVEPRTTKVEPQSTVAPIVASTPNNPPQSSYSNDDSPVQKFTATASGIRVGTADGKRLRIVVDLEPGNEEPTANVIPLNGDVIRILLAAQIRPGARVKYEGKKASGLGAVSFSFSNEGLLLSIVPKTAMFLKETFTLKAGKGAPNDRFVIDLCVVSDCRSLRSQ